MDRATALSIVASKTRITKGMPMGTGVVQDSVYLTIKSPQRPFQGDRAIWFSTSHQFELRLPGYARTIQQIIGLIQEELGDVFGPDLANRKGVARPIMVTCLTMRQYNLACKDVADFVRKHSTAG